MLLFFRVSYQNLGKTCLVFVQLYLDPLHNFPLSIPQAA